jgi:hypothetical protein
MSAPPPVHRASWALRLGLAVQSAALVWLALEHGTSLDAVLFMELGKGEASARFADRVLAGVAALAATTLLWRPLRSAVLALSLVFLTVAVTTVIAGGRAFSDLAPMAHATRWAAPLALLFLTARARPRSTAAALTVLRLSVAATFLAHGWEALQHHPAFLDLLLGSCRRWTGSAPAEASARHVLTVIGALDVLVVLALLFTRWRFVAAWATLWGLITLASRIVALGGDFLHESLLRSMNAFAPLALWFLLAKNDPPSDP